jgi:hypothetical protein
MAGHGFGTQRNQYWWSLQNISPGQPGSEIKIWSNYTQAWKTISIYSTANANNLFKTLHLDNERPKLKYQSHISNYVAFLQHCIFQDSRNNSMSYICNILSEKKT